ncbi:MAG: hypothetical protein B7733_05380 [Myxococcales bacterium FL481]|nr:MAG: hypothetical protein B7733_05380 [Myxococcales bacterium FL481]
MCGREFVCARQFGALCRMVTHAFVLWSFVSGCQNAASSSSVTASKVPARNDSDGVPEPASPSEPSRDPLRIVKIATATHHACALLSDGTLRCWGEAIHGQLGYGNRTDVSLEDAPHQPPVHVGGKVVDVSAGMRHTCVVLDNGDVRCFGSNEHWQLGVLEAYFGEVPELTARVLPIRQTSYGSLTWTADEGRYSERTGVNEDVRRRTRTGDDEAPAVFPSVELPAGAVEIDVGQSHSCARLDTGDVYCWGWQAEWTSRMPHRVNIGAWPVQMSAGRRATCVVTHVQKVRCWGSSHIMRQPDSDPRHVCRETMSRSECKAAVAAVQPGAFGRLGYADVLEVHAEDVAGLGDVGARRPVWQIGEEFPRAIVQVEVGDLQICGITQDQRLACWGSHWQTWDNRIPVRSDAMAFSYVDFGNAEWTPRAVAAQGSDFCVVLDAAVGELVGCWGGPLGWLPRGLTADRRSMVELLEPIDVLAVQDHRDQGDFHHPDGGGHVGYLGRGSRLWHWSDAEGALMPAGGIDFDVRPRPPQGHD